MMSDNVQRTSSSTAPLGSSPGLRAQEGPRVPQADGPPLEEVRIGDTVLAIIIRSSYTNPGVSFFSEPGFSQQLGYIQHPAGHMIPAHVHNPVPRRVTYTQEVLFVRRGSIRVHLYRDDRTLFASRTLAAGDVVFLPQGGHGFEILEDCELIEVKQGPYAGHDDKTRFEPIAEPAAEATEEPSP